MWGWDGGLVCVKNLSFSEVPCLTPVDFKKKLHYKKGVPCAGPRGTLSFTTRHSTCQTRIVPRPPLGNADAKSLDMSPIHVSLYGRMVNCHVACTDYIINILHVWENGQNVISLSYELCFIPFMLHWDHEDEIYTMNLFSSKSEHFDF
jgi:hypothetical protein